MHLWDFNIEVKNYKLIVDIIGVLKKIQFLRLRSEARMIFFNLKKSFFKPITSGSVKKLYVSISMLRIKKELHLSYFRSFERLYYHR